MTTITTMRTIEWKGVDIPVEFIDDGIHTSAYRSLVNPQDVFLIVLTQWYDQTKDICKQVLLDINNHRSPNKHIPFIEEIGHIERGPHYYTVYHTRWYRAVDPYNDTDAFAIMKYLIQENEKAWNNYPQEHKKKDYTCVNYMCDFLDAIKESVPASIFDALESIYIWGSSYSGDSRLDLAHENFGLDDDGNLIFIDPIVKMIFF